MKFQAANTLKFLYSIKLPFNSAEDDSIVSVSMENHQLKTLDIKFNIHKR